MRKFTAKFAVTNTHEPSRNLAVQGNPPLPWFLKSFRMFASTSSDPRESLVIVAANGSNHRLDTVCPPGAPLSPVREGKELDDVGLLAPIFAGLSVAFDAFAKPSSQTSG